MSGRTRNGQAILILLAAVLSLRTLGAEEKSAPPSAAPAPPGCPAEMVRVGDYCVDRWEASMVDKTTRRAISPYYPPHPKLLREVFRGWQIERELMGSDGARAMPLPELPEWQRREPFEPLAVSRPSVVPQAYVSYYVAKRACENAGKRLCRREEWVRACRGAENRTFPYGDSFDRSQCNVWGYIHPALVLHDNSSVGHRDPRLNLLAIAGDRPLLRKTGETPTCASRFGADAIFDMVGNLDEWVQDEDKGLFVGGFYARSTSKGCDSQVSNHSLVYHDYSTGARCCKDVAR